MREDSDITLPTTGMDGTQQGEFSRLFAQRMDFPSGGVRIGHHAIEILRDHVRVDAGPELGKVPRVVVRVVKVENQPDVIAALGLEGGEDEQLIVGIAEPTKMIVEANRAAQATRFGGDRTQPFDREARAPFVRLPCARVAWTALNPERGLIA